VKSRSSEMGSHKELYTPLTVISVTGALHSNYTVNKIILPQKLTIPDRFSRQCSIHHSFHRWMGDSENYIFIFFCLTSLHFQSYSRLLQVLKRQSLQMAAGGFYWMATLSVPNKQLTNSKGISIYWLY